MKLVRTKEDFDNKIDKKERKFGFVNHRVFIENEPPEKVNIIHNNVRVR